MKRSILVSVLFSLLWFVVCGVASATTTLVAVGSVWKYLDNGSDQGTAWYAAGFNDSSWASGPAKLGYGEGDEATTVSFGPNPSNKYITTYFRHSFSVADPSAYQSLYLRILRDDGAVVYLNGMEVFRVNMPAGAITYTTLAPVSVGTATTYDPCVVSAAALVAGTNVLAVEIHQRAANSSDISFNLELQGDTVLPAILVRKGPYLIYPHDNTQMTVLWQLDATTSCLLDWGLDTSYSAGSINSVEYGTDHQHKETIAGLTPGSLYYYRVHVEASDYTGSFRAGPPASATNLKFLAYGDTRTNPDFHDSVCARIVPAFTADRAYQTFLLHAGDWVERGDEEIRWTNEFFNRSYPNALNMQANIPIEGCMGNHEDTGAIYMKYWPYPYEADRYYSYDYGPIHVAVVDQYVSYSTNSAQLVWLDNDLAASGKQWKFLLFHAPGWSAAGGGHANTVQVQTVIQPLCVQYGIEVVFCGHNHYYARALVNGVHHITTGGGGAPLANPDPGQPYIEVTTKTLHFCKIAITGNNLVFQAVNASGAQIDTFTLNHPAPTAPSNPGATGIATNQITWTWQDNSSNETSFYVYAGPGATAPATSSTAVIPNTQSWPQTGLSPNTQYAFQAASEYFWAESAKTASISRTTLAATPVAPVVTNPTSSTLDVAIGVGDGNPAATLYAIRISPTVGGNAWIQADGTAGAAAAYQTAAAWGTTTVTGLAENTEYTFATTARNGDGVVTAEGPGASRTTSTATTPASDIHIWRIY